MPASLVLDCRDSVGESPVWSAAEQALYWVDIVGSRIHRFVPATREHRTWPTPELPTSIGLARDGGFVVGLRHRVALWAPGREFVTVAVPEPDRPKNRLNEGSVAPDGTFWVGTMQDNIDPRGEPMPIESGQGRLYRVRANGEVELLTDHAFGITNTMIWEDGGTFVTADTMANELYRFAVGSDGLALIDRLPHAVHCGVPDGSAVDSRGTIYNARVAGGACIAKILARGGTEMLELPCSSPTSCAFGGADLKTLFITSARFGLSCDALAANPSEGGLFAVEMDVPGRLPWTFGMPADR